MNRVNLLDFDLDGLVGFFESIGEKPFRARQVLRWLHHFGADDFEQMTDLAKSLRARLPEVAEIRPPLLGHEQRSVDGTRKWLLEVGPSNRVETVFIPEGDLEGRRRGPAEWGYDPEEGCEAPIEGASIPHAARSPSGGGSDDASGRYRGTLCVSTQAGCALDCAFCSTGKQGFNRNLTAAEIIGQLWWANKALGRDPKGDRLISNVVLMGMGEPLLNFENTVTAVSLMLDDHAYGLSKRRVTISTSGIVPAMDRLRERLPVALAVSLHAPNDALRDQLVPINQKYPLKELMAACQRYVQDGPRDFITFEYVMLEGVNDQPEHAEQLLQLTRDVSCKFNLIPFNPFPDSGFRRSSAETVRRFAGILMAAGKIATTRKTRGDDIDAACGQLAGEVEDKSRRVLKRMELTV